MFKVIMSLNGHMIDMPHDNGLHLVDACNRADIYKRRNGYAVFLVINAENGDIEYQA